MGSKKAIRTATFGVMVGRRKQAHSKAAPVVLWALLDVSLPSRRDAARLASTLLLDPDVCAVQVFDDRDRRELQVAAYDGRLEFVKVERQEHEKREASKEWVS